MGSNIRHVRSIGSDRIIDQKHSFPDFQARTTENVCYFDNITFLQNQEQQVEVQQALLLYYQWILNLNNCLFVSGFDFDGT
jgi:hypothetical protein